MSRKSSSRTSRTYNTTNASLQGEGNVYGTHNRVTIQHADAMTLDNIAKALAAGVEDLSRQGEDQTRRALQAGTDMTRRTLDTSRDMTRRTLDTSRDMTRRTLDTTRDINRDSLDAVTGTAGDAMRRLERMALEVQSGAEKGTQQAMDFASNFTEREQIGSEGEQLRTLQYVAAAVAVALVGIAWASKGGMRA